MLDLLADLFPSFLHLASQPQLNQAFVTLSPPEWKRNTRAPRAYVQAGRLRLWTGSDFLPVIIAVESSWLLHPVCV